MERDSTPIFGQFWFDLILVSAAGLFCIRLSSISTGWHFYRLSLRIRLFGFLGCRFGSALFGLAYWSSLIRYLSWKMPRISPLSQRMQSHTGSIILGNRFNSTRRLISE